MTIFVIFLVTVLSSIFLILHFSGTFSFTLRTEFPSYPTSVQMYRVDGIDQQEIGNPAITGFGFSGPPSENQAIQIAQEYLESHDVLPQDAVLADTQLHVIYAQNYVTGDSVEIPQQYYVSFKRILDNRPVVGPGDTLWVYIACENESSTNQVVYFFKRWRNVTVAGEEEIISPSEAYKKLTNGEILNKPMQIEPFPIYNISLGYYSALESLSEGVYKPVWIFYGAFENRQYYVVDACT